jgi:tRNA(Ile)-lysidine synthase
VQHGVLPHMSPPDFEPALADALDELAISGHVLVAVSGGADSVALLRGLVSLHSGRPLEIVAAHLDHQLRGDDSTADAELVRSLCESLHVSLIVQQRDIRRSAAEQGIGIEEAARNARYEFLTATAIEQRCAWVLVAHTADDQVETVLHHILRGTGIEGLRGIPATRPLTDRVTLARPLLNIGRACIEAYLRSLPQVWRDDATNRDTTLTRNRIRHDLLPILRDRFNPQIEAAILHLAQHAVELQSVIDQFAADLHSSCCLAAEPHVVRLDADQLDAAAPHLVREVLRRVWRSQGWPLGGMGLDHWTAAAQVALGEVTAVDLPGGVHAARRGTLLTLTRKNALQRVDSSSAPG